MPKTASSQLISRRRFLRGLGFAAGACVAGPAISASQLIGAPSVVASTSRRELPFTVGVLLPQSQIAPTFGPNLLAGLQIAFASQNSLADSPVQLHAEPVGASAASVYNAARKLLAERRAHLLIGGISRHGSASLGNLLREYGTPLVVADIGANMLRPDRERPLIVRNSLNHWRSSWALGQWAATNVGRRGFIASSFYDSGYDTLYAFRQGFEAGGGTAGQSYVAHLPMSSGDPIALIAQIKAERPDFVFAAFSGPKAAEFVRAYAEAGLSGQIPLLGSSFLADGAIAAGAGQQAIGIISAFSWGQGIDTPEHRAFANAFQQATGRPADAFAALGYDTGQMIGAANKGLQVPAGGSTMLGEALHSVNFVGARGPITIADNTLDAVSPVYLRVVRRQAGSLEQVVVQQLGAPDSFTTTIVPIPEGPKTGWSNAYLCV